MMRTVANRRLAEHAESDDTSGKVPLTVGDGGRMRATGVRSAANPHFAPHGSRGVRGCGLIARRATLHLGLP